MLSVVIPAYCEEARVGSSLERIVDYLEEESRAFEILVVDDGSTDRTAEAASAFEDRGVRVLRLATNRGKGAAVRTGVLASRGSEVLISDADLSTPIEELEALAPWLASHTLVMGSRALADSRITTRQPRYREWMGKTFNRILRTLTLVEFQDTQCGFKLLRGDEARELFARMEVDRFAWDVELVLLAQAAGWRIAEVGVEWAHSPTSKVDPVWDALRMLLDVLWMRLRLRKIGRR